jgi:hypothetical protein
MIDDDDDKDRDYQEREIEDCDRCQAAWTCGSNVKPRSVSDEGANGITPNPVVGVKLLCNTLAFWYVRHGILLPSELR